MGLRTRRESKKCEFRFLVPHSIIKNLNEISKNSVRIRMEELLKKYEAKYREALTYFITVHNEIVLEVKSHSSGHHRSMQSTGERMPRGWTGIEELVRKIDFSNVLHENVIKYSDREISVEDVDNYEPIHFYCDFSDSVGRTEGQSLEILEKFLGVAKIPNFFEKVPWTSSKMYTGTVANIYDPSKLWIRFAEVDILQKHLWNFYNMKKKEYVLSPSDMKIRLNCAVFVEGSYHRGRVVKIDIQDPNWFVVYLYDQGKIHRLNRDDLFKLHEKFRIFPEFAVRCSLANVSPIDHETWTTEAVDRFKELAKENKKLVVKISHVNCERKMLEVYLADSIARDNGTIPTFNHLLVHEKLAKVNSEKPKVSKKDHPFMLLRKFMYLYPTHEMIEDGSAPSTFSLTEQLRKCVAWDVLFPQLYKYQP